ncbi:hypothetical protein ACFVU2_19265 [Leifsonia sp. NPDC058194]|uniref:hypothetical protein n=1 Tax=Leifsonia sp. NPDC058194 TaxID=3346374 RepID=UPI0036DC0D07
MDTATEILHGEATVIVRRKLPDDLGLGEYRSIVGRLEEMCVMSTLLPEVAPAARVGVMAETTKKPGLLRAQYGSDFFMVISVALGLAGGIKALAYAVKSVAEAAKALAEAREIDAKVNEILARSTRTEHRSAQVQRRRILRDEAGFDLVVAKLAEALDEAGYADSAEAVRRRDRDDPRYNLIAMVQGLAEWDLDIQVKDDGDENES